MSDILIRNVPDGLKLQLTDSARRAGRSVSDEAIAILRASLPIEAAKPVSLAESIRAILGDDRLTDEELRTIADVRHGPSREPPRFDR